MPFEISTFQLPGGARCVRVDMIGTVTGEEAAAIVSQMDPGGRFHGLSLLVQGLKMDHLTSEARQAFTDRRSPPPMEWMAVVLTNPILRVTSNLIMRMTRNVRRRLFSTEEEAIRWLDERVSQG